MRSIVRLPNNTTPLPDGFSGPDVRYSEAFVRYFLDAFTKPGDVVFDPFAGFGTTLRVAEAMGREAWGIEYDAARAAYIRSHLRHPERLIHGDSRRLSDYAFPPFDFSLTSPPYCSRFDHENPLTNYSETGQGYAAYLQGLQAIYRQLAGRCKPGATLVIEAANLKNGEAVDTLAWDIAATVGKVLPFRGEIIIDWQPTYGFGYDHSYALVFAAGS